MGLTPHIMAIERVQQRLRKVAAALDAAGVRYAVVGGNAVASWVARVDPHATRATKDVDHLVRRADLPRVSAAITALGFAREDLRDLVLFIDPDEPSKKSGVHLVWAGELIRPSYSVESPTVEESVRDDEGYWVLDLPALVRMKLTSFRPVDQTHILDMLGVGLIDEAVRVGLPADLLERLDRLGAEES